MGTEPDSVSVPGDPGDAHSFSHLARAVIAFGNGRKQVKHPGKRIFIYSN